ncbi:MAG TPA: ABC transporter permease, partial [Candidatus Dormibacteraeota bacterium]|nr:ABC transporter permease [Candidatus Dormibacteraeota bacterium]
ETYRRGYHNPTIRTAFVKARPGFGAADVRREVDIGAAGFPGVSVSDPVQYAMAQAAAVERPVALVDALVLLAVAIALLGVMNTLSLAVVERTRDLGLLRVLGMTRGQLALTVHLEALMVVALGLLGGAAAGLAGGLALVAALGFQGITDLVVPAGPLLAAFALVLAGALAAAALPARRAARLGLEAAIAG